MEIDPATHNAIVEEMKTHINGLVETFTNEMKETTEIAKAGSDLAYRTRTESIKMNEAVLKKIDEISLQIKPLTDIYNGGKGFWTFGKFFFAVLTGIMALAVSIKILFFGGNSPKL